MPDQNGVSSIFNQATGAWEYFDKSGNRIKNPAGGGGSLDYVSQQGGSGEATPVEDMANRRESDARWNALDQWFADLQEGKRMGAGEIAAGQASERGQEAASSMMASAAGMNPGLAARMAGDYRSKIAIGGAQEAAKMKAMEQQAAGAARVGIAQSMENASMDRQKLGLQRDMFEEQKRQFELQMQQAAQARESSMWSSIFGTVGGLIGSFAGPIGTALGSAAGSQLGGAVGSQPGSSVVSPSFDLDYYNNQASRGMVPGWNNGAPSGYNDGWA